MIRCFASVSEHDSLIVSRDNEWTENKSAPAPRQRCALGPNPRTGGLMAETMPRATDTLAQARPAVSE